MSAEIIKTDLERLLSSEAAIALPSSVEFARSNLRFTEYERPVCVPISDIALEFLT